MNNNKLLLGLFIISLVLTLIFFPHNVSAESGVTTLDDTHWVQDDNGHGTMVAGVISSLDNDLGVVGVAPESELYSIKVLDEGGSGKVGDIIEGIEWGVDEDIPVLNMSLGMGYYSGSLDSESLEEATSEAYAEEHLLIWASGNEGGR